MDKRIFNVHHVQRRFAVRRCVGAGPRSYFHIHSFDGNHQLAEQSAHGINHSGSPAATLVLAETVDLFALDTRDFGPGDDSFEWVAEV